LVESTKFSLAKILPSLVDWTYLPTIA
jgi:hypothetical protein